MKKLCEWSVKELVNGYGNDVDINEDMDHIDALHSVLEYEVDSYNEKYKDDIETVFIGEELLELDEDEEISNSIPQY